MSQVFAVKLLRHLASAHVHSEAEVTAAEEVDHLEGYDSDNTTPIGSNLSPGLQTETDTQDYLFVCP